MKPCLVDVNVWLALLVPRHTHHREASAWFERLAPGEAGLCRFVQLGVMRLLGNRAVMGEEAIAASEAWRILGGLLEDERVCFVPEPLAVDGFLERQFRYRVPTRNLISDAYLAAFALSSDRRLVTLDRGFQQFTGLDVVILG